MSVTLRVHIFTDVRLCLIAKQNECWIGFSSIHLLSVPADIIQLFFIICIVEFTNHDHLMDANAAVLLYFVAMTQTHPFAVQVTPKILIQFFPTYHTFSVSSYCLKWNLLLKTFPLICKLSPL